MTPRPALLIIDMQNDFVLPGGVLPVPGAGAIIGNIRLVLDAFRARSLPVIHVVRVHRGDGSDVEWFRRETFSATPFAVEGTRGAAVIEELTPVPGEILLRKIRMSAFLGTDLDLVLRTLGVGTLVITGIQTPNCVRTTVFDAMALGYQVTLVSDAVAAKNSAIHEANLTDMAGIGVRMINSRDVESSLDENVVFAHLKRIH